MIRSRPFVVHTLLLTEIVFVKLSIEESVQQIYNLRNHREVFRSGKDAELLGMCDNEHT